MGLYPVAVNIYFKWIAVKRNLNVHFFLPILSRAALARRIWYGLFSNVFAHEMDMFAKARLNYYRQMESTQGNIFLLRRNVHRIEKGLLMENRKPLFALDYIAETVEEYLKIRQHNPTSSVLDWADDVLTSYFGVVAEHPTVSMARQKFNLNKTKPIDCKLEFIPFVSKPFNQDELPLIASLFGQLVHHRKSVRVFEKEKIPSRQLIDQAVALANQSPSSCNRQPYQFLFFDDKNLVSKLSEIPGGTKGFSAGIPMLCVVVGQMDVSPSPGDKHLMYVDGSLAAMTLMLALESLGLSSCPINWPDNADIEKKFRKHVPLKPYERPLMMIAIGYAHQEGLVAFSKRKGLDEIRKYN